MYHPMRPFPARGSALSVVVKSPSHSLRDDRTQTSGDTRTLTRFFPMLLEKRLLPDRLDIRHLGLRVAVGGCSLKFTGLAHRAGLWDDCGMGSKDKGKKETKKPPKPKSKAAPRKREDVNPVAARIIREPTERV